MGGLIILFLYLVSLISLVKLEVYKFNLVMLFVVVRLIFPRFFINFNLMLEFRSVFFFDNIFIFLGVVLLLILLIVVKTVDFYGGALKCILND